jgi:phospholipase C
MWSYDGSGGWYDHVPPLTIQGRATGLRVPALLVSAYARRGQINHTPLDYTSALRFIEENWGVPALTARDASVASLTSAFDFGAARPAAITAPGGAPPAPRRPNPKVIYGGYGAAATFGLALLAIAAGAPALAALRRRWRPAVTKRAFWIRPPGSGRSRR